jgi:dephospho-CoA kinase
MKNIVLGLTGQTGAGKSTLCQYLQQKGCSIIDADQVARDVVEKGSDCIADVILEFGIEYLNMDGSLNRRKLAESVFTDKAKLKKLNDIMFPYIIRNIEEKIQLKKEAEEGIIVLDAPTLFESGCDKFCDKVVSVIATEEVR